MGKIFEVIGTPGPDEDLSAFLESEESQAYVRSFQPRSRVDLSVLYPGTEQRGIALLYRMLEFNPNNRISAEEALKDPYFDDIRLPE